MSYTSVEQLKLYLEIAQNDDDVLLGDCITRAQKAIETYTNRNFEAASATRSYGWDAVDGLWLWLGYDLYSLDSVANGDSSGTAIATADITEFPINDGPPYHRLRLDSGSTSTWNVDTDYWIEVTGDWGYSASPPSDIVQAAVRWAAYFYRQKDTGQFETVAVQEGGVLTVPRGIPEDVLELIRPYRRFSL